MRLILYGVLRVLSGSLVLMWLGLLRVVSCLLMLLWRGGVSRMVWLLFSLIRGFVNFLGRLRRILLDRVILLLQMTVHATLRLIGVRLRLRRFLFLTIL